METKKTKSSVLVVVFGALLLLVSYKTRGYEEKMYFVSEIRIDRTTLAGDLCLVQKESMMFGAVYHKDPLRHVVGEKGCVGDRYVNIPLNLSMVLQEEGVVLDLPEPSRNRRAHQSMFFLVFVGLVCVMFPVIDRITPRKR